MNPAATMRTARMLWSVSPRGPKRDPTHEKRGRQTEPRIASGLVQPYGHPEQGKRGKKLVRHAEKIPENPPGRDAFAVDDQRRNAEDDERKNERQRRRGRRPRLPLPSGQLHQDIPCQPRAGVERVEDKSGEAQQRELESDLRTDQPEGCLGDTQNENAGDAKWVCKLLLIFPVSAMEVAHPFLDKPPELRLPRRPDFGRETLGLADHSR